jgi:transglutaminase-like putative cysteine protease
VWFIAFNDIIAPPALTDPFAMKRRDFIATAAALAAFPKLSFAQQKEFNPVQGEKWRSFEIVTRIDVAKPSGVVRVWVPVPVVDESWQQTRGNAWTGNATAMRLASDPKYGATMVYAEFPASQKAPALEVTSRFATRDRAVDLGRPRDVAPLAASDRAFYTAPTELQPTDGIVRKTALEATRGAKTDLDKARRLYEWVVENTFRDPKTRGCGVGDIKGMLETKNLSGKCADLNALYVGMARSIGLPARDVYGLRVAKSEFGYRSLGAGSPNVTRAQHCRAEVWVAGYGWIPVDPADVRKVVLEEKPQPVTLADPVVPAVRRKLFGAWEMNWLAYNRAHDVSLPGSTGPKVGFLMYPQAEDAAGRMDCLDPDTFKYTITAREITA